MPNPTHSNVHVSRPLTDLSVAYFTANAGRYGAMRVFPTVAVMKQSDKYRTYNRGDLLRVQADRRAPGAEAPVGGYRMSDDNYFCDRWSMAKDVDDPTRANADAGINLDREAVDFVTNQIELAKENEWLADFFATGVWDGASSSTDLTGVSSAPSTATQFLQWNDVASTPIEDVRGEIAAVEENAGYRPNKFALGPHTYRHLQDHPDIIDRIKNTVPGSPATINRQLLAGLFELDEVVVLQAVKNSAAEAAAGSFAYMAGKHALLAYVPPSPGLYTPAAGYTFVWTGAGIPAQGARIKRYRLERNESDRIEGETWVDGKKVASDLAAFFASAVA